MPSSAHRGGGSDGNMGPHTGSDTPYSLPELDPSSPYMGHREGVRVYGDKVAEAIKRMKETLAHHQKLGEK